MVSIEIIETDFIHKKLHFFLLNADDWPMKVVTYSKLKILYLSSQILFQVIIHCQNSFCTTTFDPQDKCLQKVLGALSEKTKPENAYRNIINAHRGEKDIKIKADSGPAPTSHLGNYIENEADLVKKGEGIVVSSSYVSAIRNSLKHNYGDAVLSVGDSNIYYKISRVTSNGKFYELITAFGDMRYIEQVTSPNGIIRWNFVDKSQTSFIVPPASPHGIKGLSKKITSKMKKIFSNIFPSETLKTLS